MKPIIFTGDSFTFGEGLELYDDRYRDFIYQTVKVQKNLEKQGKTLEWDEGNYMWHQWTDFSENIIPAGKLRYELSYPALVSDHFNVLGFRKPHNGGSQRTALDFIKKCENRFGIDNFSLTIINLTSPDRDELFFLFDFFKNTFDIDITNPFRENESIIKYIHRLFLNWESIDSVDRKTFREDKFMFGHITKQSWGKNPKFISLSDAQKLQDYFGDWDGWIKGITTLYYKEYVKKLDEINTPYYFLGHWNTFDSECFDSVDDSEVIQKIKRRMIPIYKGSKEITLSDEMRRKTDFYLYSDSVFPWTQNQHPSKEGHRIIADSIIKYIKENQLV